MGTSRLEGKAKEVAAKAGKTKRQRAYERRNAPDEDEDEEHAELPPALARKVMREAAAQKAEAEGVVAKAPVKRGARGEGPSKRSVTFRGDGSSDDEAAEEGDDEEEELEGAPEYYDEAEDIQLAEDEEKALELFMGGGKARNLADIIMEKIAQRNDALVAEGGEEPKAQPVPMPELPAKVIEVYQGVGRLLKSYRSGKLPKAFKIVPRLANWEEVLYVTDPDSWSAAATREATRLFASNMNSKMAQRFFNLVLLPAVLEDINTNRRLNFHLYLALKKALYKPAAFFKGVLLPMCESRCTLRQALIVCSVLQKVSIPMLHSAVAIMKLAEMSFSGANALFLRTLILKKYALPYRVIDQLVEYFASFESEDEQPTVLWQQTLLAFVQHYKAEVTSEQKEKLKSLMRTHSHPTITSEIRRELFSSRNRGDPYMPVAGSDEPVPMQE